MLHIIFNLEKTKMFSFCYHNNNWMVGFLFPFSITQSEKQTFLEWNKQTAGKSFDFIIFILCKCFDNMCLKEVEKIISEYTQWSLFGLLARRFVVKTN